MRAEDSRRIVILGGGTGGIVLANELRRKLSALHHIVVIERSETHAFAPSFLWLMVGQRRREGITTRVRQMLLPGIELIIGEAEEIDPIQRLIRVGSETIPYDQLVLASGADMHFEVPGAHTFFTVDGAERLYAALREFRGESVAVVVSSTPYKCPGAPAEGAMLIRDFLRHKGVQARVDLYTPEPHPMPVAGPALGDAVRGMLAERGIGYQAGHTLRSVDGTALSFEGRAPISADLLVVIPKHEPPAIVRKAGVANQAGWAAVDPRTMATRDPSIFAIGDCASFSLPGRWKPDTPLLLPKAGVFAHAQALALASRIVASVGGDHPLPEFLGEGFCILEAGKNLAGFAYGDFYATPNPDIQLHSVGKAWHLSKVLFERWWLAPLGLRKKAYAMAMQTGGRLYGVSVTL